MKSKRDSCAPDVTPAPKPTRPPPRQPPQSTTQTIRFEYDGGRKVTIKSGPDKGKKIAAPPKGVCSLVILYAYASALINSGYGEYV